MADDYNIASGFVGSALRFPEHLFLADSLNSFSYGQMYKQAAQLAGHLSASGRPKRVGILGTRSVEAYAGVLAAAIAGAAYVPLNLKWPPQRIAELLGVLDLDALVVDANGASLLTEAVLASAPAIIVVADKAAPLSPVPGQTVTRFGEMDAQPLAQPVPVGPDDLAYIIFTSGTTGTPKGVMISAGSLASYVEESRPWTQLTPDDRLAETCDLTFDLSVHNLFLAAEAGASLHILTPLDMLAPARFLRARDITVWMSVPTLAATMRKAGALKPGIFPHLRLSIFCGEPLPASLARAWADATVGGRVENIYGPTEGTVICMRQTLTEPPLTTGERGILAIGTPYETMTVAILDAQQKPVRDGLPGEIALSGPQLAQGYLNASPEQDARFCILDGQRWYLTGDLGMRDENGVFHHLGRTDNQVKVKGNRIELEEVEAHLRRACDSDGVAVVAWPLLDGVPQGLVGFCTSALTPEQITEALLTTLPRYMVPEPIHVVATLPVNINGKVDRRALIDRLVHEQAAPATARNLEHTSEGKP